MAYSDCIVLIPCFNESASIKATIDHVREYLDEATIIVIDNCSSDNTGEIARNSGAVVLTESRQGKGYAVRRGFEATSKLDFKVVLMIDGDATYSVEKFANAYDLVTKQNIDMVIGNRIEAGNINIGRTEAYRKFHTTGNKFLTGLNKTLFSTEILDTLSGWRAFSPNFINSFSGGLSAFEIESELNTHAFVLQCPIGNIDVEYHGRLDGSESKLRTIPDGIKILRRQLRLFRSERPFFAFNLLALPWFLLSLYLVLSVISEFFKIHKVPNFPSLIAGVAAFIVSSLLWVTGIILENVRLGRVQETYYQYRRTQR